MLSCLHVWCLSLTVWQLPPIHLRNQLAAAVWQHYNSRGTCLSNMDSATVASSRANWSPTHLRAPPPKGMNAKSAATSLGYRDDPWASGLYPAHLPSNAGLLLVSANRSGLKVSGSFHRWGDLADWSQTVYWPPLNVVYTITYCCCPFLTIQLMHCARAQRKQCIF